MAAIVNARDTLLQAAGTRLVAATLPSNMSADWSTQVTGTGKPANNADVTLAAVNGTLVVTGGGLTMSGGGAVKGGKTTYGSGTGFFLGWSGSAYVFDIGSSSGYLRWTGSALDLIGNITGSSSINITGTAKFEGQTTTGGFTAAVAANSSGNAPVGVYGIAGSFVGGISIGVQGSATAGSGVNGNATTGIAVSGVATSGGGSGGVFSNTAGGTALVSQGPMSITVSTMVTNLNAQYLGGFLASAFARDGAGTGVSVGAATSGSSTATFPATNKPGSSSSNIWVPITIGGVVYDVPAWTR